MAMIYACSEDRNKRKFQRIFQQKFKCLRQKYIFNEKTNIYYYNIGHAITAAATTAAAAVTATTTTAAATAASGAETCDPTIMKQIEEVEPDSQTGLYDRIKIQMSTRNFRQFDQNTV